MTRPTPAIPEWAFDPAHPSHDGPVWVHENGVDALPCRADGWVVTATTPPADGVEDIERVLVVQRHPSVQGQLRFAPTLVLVDRADIVRTPQWFALWRPRHDPDSAWPPIPADLPDEPAQPA